MTPLQIDDVQLKAITDARLRRETWVIMPIRAQRDYTMAAIGDVLQQTAPLTLLLVNQGVEDDFRTELERVAEAHDHVMVWSHQPPLPSLSATWNRALDAAWAAGAEVALVVNNDVRLHAQTVETLIRTLQKAGALFVSAVGVRAEQFDAQADPVQEVLLDSTTGKETPVHKGGPDFSCFLISKACHQRFRFDESFIPAFCEDLDYHRRLMLAGEGRRIFSVNLPYLHYASATLKALPPEEADRIRAQIELGSRVYYAKKWGGPVNQERYLIPFGGGWSKPRQHDQATTPDLQGHLRSGEVFPFELTAEEQRYLGGQGNFKAAPGELDHVKALDTAAAALPPELRERFRQANDRLARDVDE
jgi:GT2 family glycosyltransferase